MDVVKNWPEPKSIRDIQVFFNFANFYSCFIWAYIKIAGSFTEILKTSSTNWSSENSLLKMANNSKVDSGDGDD